MLIRNTFQRIFSKHDQLMQYVTVSPHIRIDTSMSTPTGDSIILLFSRFNQAAFDVTEYNLETSIHHQAFYFYFSLSFTESQ